MIRKLLSLTLVLILSTAAPAFAASAPEDTVKEIVGKLKDKGDPAVVLDYVSWEDAYKDTPPQVLQSLGVTDAAGLKDQTGRLMSEPAKFVREKMSQRISSLPPDQQAIMNQQLEPLTKKVEKEFADMKDKLKRTEFAVGKTEVAGDTAVVDITASVDGTTQQNKLKLVKRGDSWLLASPELGKKQNPRPAGGSAVAPGAKNMSPVAPPSQAPAPH